MVKKKRNHIFLFMLKIVLTILTFVFIYFKVKDFDLLNFKFPNCDFKTCLLFFFVLFLMPVNWIVESVKWKFLIKKIEDVSLPRAIKAVLTGIAFALISPARVGEVPGRVFVLKKEHRVKALFATAAGSLSQMLVTLSAGVIGGIFFLFFFADKTEKPDAELIFYLKIVSVALLLVGFMLLFNIKYVYSILKKWRPKSAGVKHFEILSEYSVRELFIVLGYSFLRYVIFCTQFIILLYLFDVRILWYEALIGISLSYLFSSLIPVLSIFEIGVRGMSSILFLGIFTANIPGILSATVFLWLINLALPAIIGSGTFYKTKI